MGLPFCSQGRNALSSPGTWTSARYNRAFEIVREHTIMEAEQINLIANTLDGIGARTSELRRYL